MTSVRMPDKPPACSCCGIPATLFGELKNKRGAIVYTFAVCEECASTLIYFVEGDDLG
jgi:hypothetical protein